MGQADIQYDAIKQEFNKLMMCKNGTLWTELNGRRKVIRSEIDLEPILLLKDRQDLFKKNRKKLLRNLKLKPSDQLAHLTSQSGITIELYTRDSMRSYKKAVKKLFTHPDHKAWEDRREDRKKRRVMMREEITHRIAYMEAEFKEAKMGLITGSIPISQFVETLDTLEAREY